MSAIRALAEDLAARSDAELRQLMAARPDIVLPSVPDFSALAARASTRVSVQRALESLSAPCLAVLETLVLVSDPDAPAGITASDLKNAVAGVSAKTLQPYLNHLHSLALLRSGATLRGRKSFYPLETLQEALGPYPAGLGRPLSTLARQYPDFGERVITGLQLMRSEGVRLPAVQSAHDAISALAACLREDWESISALAPERAQELLQKLTVSPVGAAPAGENGSASAVGWLLARGLLVRLDANHVELPREVGVALRGQMIITDLAVSPPVPLLHTVRNSLRDNAAFGAVAETLRLVTELVAVVHAQPIATLRTGGVGVRELRRLADALRLDRDAVSWFLELAAFSHLLVLDPDSSRWITAPGDDWHALARDEQWARLVRAWLDAARAPSLVGDQVTGGGTVNALSSEATRADAPAVRRRALSAAAELTAELTGADDDGGKAAPEVAPKLDPGAVVERLNWQQPRLRRRFARLVPGMFQEMGHLGLVGSGALTELGAAVAEERFDDAVARLREALPEPLSYFMVQADLTAVAPGYLEPAVARELALLAAAEGQGPATVYRFSSESIRNALDEGLDAAAILAFLTKHSATEVPQPLRYLVEDTAARYGSLRVGQAFSYVRSDDDAALTTLVADPSAAALGLVRLAPTVVIAQATPAELAASLRQLGYFPALEGSVTRPAPRSTRAVAQTGAAPSSSVRTNPWVLTEDDAEAQLKVLRGGTRPGHGAGTESEPLLGLETLRTAIRTKQAVRLGFADSTGNATRQIFVPLSVHAGRVRVFDPDKDIERVISVHRIMDVETVEGASTDA